MPAGAWSTAAHDAMLYRARYLVTLKGPPLAWGALRVEAGRITALGPAADLPPRPGEAIWEGPEHVLLPGLINAHAHLEWHDMRSRLSSGLGFAAWVKALRSASQGFGENEYTRACRLGALEGLRHGTTTVVDIGNTGAICAAVADLPLRVFACFEVLGLDPALAEARLRAAEDRLTSTPGGPLLAKELVPHAPYSVSAPLFAALRDRAAGRLFTVHAGESRDEEVLFGSASGDLQAFCEGIYPQAPKHLGKTALAYLRENALLPPRALVVHANGASCEEAPYLARLGATVVHCPQSHAFFGHPPFEAEAYRAAGVPLALGTDSLASGTSLSLWDAMRDFARLHPKWPAESILSLCTRDAGQALATPALAGLGCLAPNAPADFIAVRQAAPADRLFDALVHETTEASLVVVAGETVIA